jgi:nucleotide-binding universal stress UspA family protein
MKKILIALDYDPSAEKVAETGFSFAKAMNAEVTLLHVISDPVYYSSTAYSPIMGFTGYMDMNPLEFESVEEIKKVSLDFLDKSKQHLGDESIKTLVTEGDFAESILKAAKDIDADMIVIGSHSKKWLDQVLTGSVTEKVLRKSSIPLLIIPTSLKK